MKTAEPTHEQLINNKELGDPVHRELYGDYSHGYLVVAVYRRESDDTYWEVVYRRLTDGKLRENCFGVNQVYPRTVEMVVYER